MVNTDLATHAVAAEVNGVNDLNEQSALLSSEAERLGEAALTVFRTSTSMLVESAARDIVAVRGRFGRVRYVEVVIDEAAKDDFQEVVDRVVKSAVRKALNYGFVLGQQANESKEI